MSQSPIDPRFAAAHYGHDIYHVKPIAAQKMTDADYKHHASLIAAMMLGQAHEDDVNQVEEYLRSESIHLASQPSAAQPAAAQPVAITSDGLKTLVERAKTLPSSLSTGDICLTPLQLSWIVGHALKEFSQPSPSASDVRYAALKEAVNVCIDKTGRFCEAMNGTAAYGARECEKAIQALKSAPAATEAGERE